MQSWGGVSVLVDNMLRYPFGAGLLESSSLKNTVMVVNCNCVLIVQSHMI